jgi:hypothetical protein
VCSHAESPKSKRINSARCAARARRKEGEEDEDDDEEDDDEEGREDRTGAK